MEMQSKALKFTIDSVPSSIDRDNMTVQHIISTQDIDRDNEIVVTAGIDITEYMKNPVVLEGHDADDPIAKCIALEFQDGQLFATTKFTPLVQDSVDRFNLIAEGIVTAWSVGFMPKEAHMEGDVRVIDSCTLLEYSSVAIPANANALCKAFKEGNKEALEILKSMNVEESKEALRDIRYSENMKMIDNKVKEFENHKIYCDKNDKDFSPVKGYLEILAKKIEELIEDPAGIDPATEIVEEEPTLKTEEVQEVKEVQDDGQDLLAELKDYLALSNLRYNASEISMIGKI